MRLTLRQLQIFSAIAEHGSTTAAAARIPLSQSATSAALGELEGLLGAPLFDRIGKRLVLNETGRALLDPAREALAAAGAIEHRFGLGDAAAHAPQPAQIRLGASTTVGNYLMPGRIAALLREQPQVRVELRIGNTRDIVAAVSRLEVDAAVVEGPCHADELEVRPWHDDAMVLVAAPGHPCARGGACDPALLRAQRWLLREPGSGTRESVDNALLPHLGGFGASMQLGSTEAIKQAACVGLGITCLSLCAVRDQLALGSLQVLETTLPALSRPLYRVQHRSKRFSPALARLLETA
ncbi:MAG TPA: LysR family transcriptional regulator [Xanthomonadaceae bacterium]|nr:LysR family transcriptional regulator [Xanthomonadaceae bacterium]